ncbi:MAG: hypothetical protein ACI8YQ_001590, partial [Polaribacter sp.]
LISTLCVSWKSKIIGKPLKINITIYTLSLDFTLAYKKRHKSEHSPYN